MDVMDTAVTVGEVTDAPPTRRRRFWLTGAALAAGGAVFVLGTPYFDIVPTNDSNLYNGLLTAGFAFLALALRRAQGPADWRMLAETFLIASAAMFVMVVGPFNWILGPDDDSVQSAVRDKLAQFLSVVPVVLLLAWLLGRSRRSLYLESGDRDRWLVFGLSAVTVGAVVVTLVALVDGASMSSIASAAPWVLVFALMNAFMEELWFRGVFLRPFESHLGVGLAVIVTALIFGAAHIEATYVSPGEQLAFAVLVTALGVALAWAVRRGKALWGGVLLHVGLDLVVIFGFV